MGKVYDTAFNPSSYSLISQTPPNMKKDNYYLYTLQQKVDADWDYRPNRVDVEQEKTIGQEDYYPLEVVIQNVRNDTGTKVSDDIRRLVFRDIKHDVRLGTKFRFSYEFDLDLPPEKKDVWLSTNKDSASPTAQVVITRCNGTLGSIYTKPDGSTEYHYEPAIITTDLKTANLYYNNVIIIPQAQVIIIVQHNQYTATYDINQRFVMGYDKVYKIKALNKFNSLTTFDPYDVGTIMLYAELDEISVKDNFETRIAYNKADTPPVPQPSPPQGELSFAITEPTPLPVELFSTPVEFHAFLLDEDGQQVPAAIEVTATLEGTDTPENYFELQIINDNTFTLRRRKLYNRSLLHVRCSIPAATSPTGVEFSQEFDLSLRGLE